MDPIGPIPIHLARAYGLSQAPQTKPTQPVEKVAPVRPARGESAGVEVRGLSIRPTQRQPLPEPTIDTTRARLVSAKVPGGIDFSAGEPTPTAAASDASAEAPGVSAASQRLLNTAARPAPTASDQLPAGRLGGYSIYRHPADRNAAATGVDLGRILDAKG